MHSSGLTFAVNQQKYDASYILTSLDFARNLFQYDKEVSSIELKLKANSDIRKVKNAIRKLLGDSFVVHDRYEQQADTFRIMEVEKLISYLFLSFILLIACFNVVGSLSMLIIDKRYDVETLRNLGADNRMVSSVFLMEGCMIAAMGAFIGIVMGVVLCWIQQEFGIIALGSGNTAGSFVVDAYPVKILVSDVVLIFVTVLIVGFVSVVYPVRYLNRRLLVKT